MSTLVRTTTQRVGSWPSTSSGPTQTPRPPYNALTDSRMLKVSLAVVFRGVQRAILSSQAKQSAKAMPASTKPSRSEPGWNVSWSVVMAKVTDSIPSKKVNGRRRAKPQAMLGMRSGSTMGTGSSSMRAGGLEVSLGRVTISTSHRTNSQRAMKCSGMSSHFFSNPFLFQPTSRKRQTYTRRKNHQLQPGPQNRAWGSKLLPVVLQGDDRG